MARERPLEPLAVGGAEASVLRAPDDQRLPVGDAREVLLHPAHANTANAIEQITTDWGDITSRLGFMKDIHSAAEVRNSAAACVSSPQEWVRFRPRSCVVIGVKKGFFEQRMERRGQVFAGPEAMRAGIVYIFIGSLCWLSSVLFAWAWYNGRVHW